jgi:hypothetical protein
LGTTQTEDAQPQTQVPSKQTTPAPKGKGNKTTVGQQKPEPTSPPAADPVTVQELSAPATPTGKGQPNPKGQGKGQTKGQPQNTQNKANPQPKGQKAQNKGQPNEQAQKQTPKTKQTNGTSKTSPAPKDDAPYQIIVQKGGAVRHPTRSIPFHHHHVSILNGKRVDLA